MAVSVSNVDLMERVCHLTNKIYGEMLCITSYEIMTARIITMVNLSYPILWMDSDSDSSRIKLAPRTPSLGLGSVCSHGTGLYFLGKF